MIIKNVFTQAQKSLQFRLMSILSKNLQYLMELKNINKNQLAKILNIPPMSVGRWVNGKITDPTLSKLFLLSNFFKLSIDDLVIYNLEIKDCLANICVEYLEIPFFKWNQIEFLEQNPKELYHVPKILLQNIDVERCFGLHPGSEYSHIYPEKTLVILTKQINYKNLDMLLVKNIMMKNIFFIKFAEERYYNILTNEKIDIEQFEILGIVESTVFSVNF